MWPALVWPSSQDRMFDRVCWTEKEDDSESGKVCNGFKVSVCVESTNCVCMIRRLVWC